MTLLQPYATAPEAIARELDVDLPVGLSSSEAARRLLVDGPNTLIAAKKVSTLRRVLSQFRDPLVWLLGAAVTVSAVAWLVEGAVGVPVDAVVIGAIILANAGLGFVQATRAADAVTALSSATESMSGVLRNGELARVRTTDLVRGDILALSEGDTIGADARVIATSTLRVSEASLTGESEAAEKTPDELDEAASLGDQVNMVFKGTSVVQGTGRAVVTGTGMSTELGTIASLIHATKETPTPLEKEIARVAKTLTVAVVVIAIVVMGTIILVDGVSSPADLTVVLLLGVSLAVAAVPEGLPALLSVVLALGVRRMAKRHALVKKLNSVEALGAVSVICSDKTGTLTRNEMTIQRVVTASGVVEVGGTGYAPVGELTAQDRAMNEAQRLELRLLLTAGCLANNAQLLERDGSWQIQGDPTEASFLVAARKLPGTAENAARYSRRSEIPFTSERKVMSTTNRDLHGNDILFVKGAPDVLLRLCTRLQEGTTTVTLGDQLRERALNDVDALNAEAFRTLGVAYRPLTEGDASSDEESLESNLIYLGVAAIVDPPRHEAAKAVREAHRAGIRVVMITGDHPTTAARIASDLGIARQGAAPLTGVQLDGLDEDALLEATRAVSVYARVSPQHKLRLIDALQRDGHIVSMTGDGVNDAPALKAADIGIAMGITGTEVSKDASRVILADDNFATIVEAVHQGRIIFDNIRKFLRYLLSSNTGEVLTVFLGVVFAGALGLADASPETVVLPLLATQILWMNLITDSGPALAMGLDPELGDVMRRGPRSASTHTVDGRMLGGVLLIGIVMALSALITIDIFLPGGFIAGSSSLDVARTAGFTTLVFAQLVNALNARSETASAFSSLFTNRWLWASIALGAALQVAVVEVPLLHVSFGTAPLDGPQWVVCLAMSSTVLWASEIRKIVLRAQDRRAVSA